ncbi:MAG: DUF4962 domain-containing protein [Phycisphaerae bacterium]|nr:DUF4962 domain-containing protein [Phycisphaerae bacterium]
MPLIGAVAALTTGLSMAADSAPRIVLDRPPAEFQKPYHPEHDATTDVNPPPFVWVPVKGQKKYAVQLARDERFSGDSVRTFRDVPWSVLVLTEPLPGGLWWWRYGVPMSGGKIAWSKARRFTVSDSAQVFPAPDVGQLISKVSEQRPRLFVPRNKRQGYRGRAASDLASTVESLRRACDKHVGEALVPEPERVQGKGAMRGKHYRSIFVKTRPPMDLMEQCGLLYLLSGQEKYGLEAKRRILHFFGWDPNGSTSYKANDEPAMWVMMRGSRAYDWTYDLFTPDERRRVEASMRIRAKQFYDHLRGRQFESNPYASHSNRTLGFLGEAALSFAREWPEAAEWLRYVTQVYWGIFPAWGADDGGWQEGPGYWNAYMSFALHFVSALKEISGHNIAAKPFFRNTPYYCIYTNPPYAGHSPFGDGQSGRPGKGRGNLMYWFSTLNRDPYVRMYADAQKSGPGNNILGVVLRDDTLRAKPWSELPQARAFPGVGLVAMHAALGDAQEDVYMLLRSSPYGGISHGHANQNAFVVEAFGEPLAIASGHYPWYGSPHHDNWTRQTKASCSITIDGGIGQRARLRSANGRITQFATGHAFDLAVGDATPAYQGNLKRFVRKVVHVRPGVFVVFDDVAAPKPSTFEWWLHGVEEMKIDPNEQRAVAGRRHARMNVRWLSPAGLAFRQTGAFDPPPEREEANWRKQWHLTASTKAKLPATTFLTVLWPWKDKAPDGQAVRDLSGQGFSACEVVLDGARNLLAFRTDDHEQGIFRLGDIETDAASVAVRFDAAGTPTHYLVEAAETLKIGSKILLDSCEPRTTSAALKN